MSTLSIHLAKAVMITSLSVINPHVQLVFVIDLARVTAILANV